MSNETKTDRKLSDDEMKSAAADFENREFTPDELTKIKRTRRRSPRIGEARAEVYTFRAPPSYKNRIKQRAASDDKTESQVIRDALDAYLQVTTTGTAQDRNVHGASATGLPTAFYPGGRSAQRPSTLHPGPQESLADVAQSLIEACAALDELWAQIPPEAWDGTTLHEPEDNPDIGPITFLQLAISRLTEVEVQGTDLDLGLCDWSDPFIDAALPMRIAWLPRRHTPSQAPSGSWNLVATDGPSFNVAVSQGVVSASPGKAYQADATISGSKADLLGLLLGRVDIADLTIAGDETTARRFATTFPPP